MNFELGQIANLEVEHFTSPIRATLGPDDQVIDAYKIMTKYNIRHLPVVEFSRVIGVVSERDLLLHIENRPKLHIHEIMTKDPLMAYGNTALMDVSYQMSGKKVGSCIIIDEDQRPIGIFTTTDALNALVETLRGEILN